MSRKYHARETPAPDRDPYWELVTEIKLVNQKIDQFQKDSIKSSDRLNIVEKILSAMPKDCEMRLKDFVSRFQPVAHISGRKIDILLSLMLSILALIVSILVKLLFFA